MLTLMTVVLCLQATPMEGHLGDDCVTFRIPAAMASAESCDPAAAKDILDAFIASHPGYEIVPPAKCREIEGMNEDRPA